QVTLWLKKLFGDHIPPYEVNERTVNILYELAEFHEARDSDVSLLAEDMKDWAAEYDARAKYLQDLFTKHLGLSPSSLSSEGASNLRMLEDCAMTLEMSNTCLGSFFSAMNDMTSKLHEKESKNRELELALGNIKNKMTAALVLQQRLKADLEKSERLLEVEKAKAETRSKNMKFLEEKSQDLNLRIKNAEEQLLATGLDQSLTHESLMSLSEKLKGAQKEIVPLKKELESYHGLPP
ncbi:HAUS augmin-like complex subunit 1, partial [Buceros rhinoceros silvestris]